MRTKINHEVPLIDFFHSLIKDDEIFGVEEEINFGANKNNSADVEYLAKNGELIILEAKTHESQDAYNTRHKIFGELLKEHGKQNPYRKKYANSLTYGILIPEDAPSSGKSNTSEKGIEFYRKGFKDIPEALYIKFGLLVNLKYVFVCSVEHMTVRVFSWSSFYNSGKELRIIEIRKNE
ncbi:MAG: hypothetical protein FD159_2646 [Syntrophaceae bacterium]|nr:MAG: hypothetical protein FD159_2646 [Syntrophaceae bacterium]